MMHRQAAIKDRLRSMAGRAGDIAHIDRRMAISTGAGGRRCGRMVHDRLAVLGRLAGMAGGAIKLGLVDGVADGTIIGNGRVPWHDGARR